MGELSDRPADEFQPFATRWLPEMVAAFLRAVRDPALAYDLATETLAAGRLRWASAPEGDERVAWVLELGTGVLSSAVERGRVPSTERRRGQQPAPSRLTAAQQRELLRLADARLELPAGARAIADDLARSAPAAHVLRELRRSDLVDAEPLPDRTRECHGS